MSRRLLLPVLALASLATAHFSLSVPKPLGDSDSKQGTGPCGGYTPSSSSPAVDFHVDGDAVGMENGHPQTNWLFRATLDQTASGGWTQVFPVVMQTGYGSFCEPQIAVPSNFTGQKGIVAVVAHSPDGLLYACSAVNFVSGAGPSRSECKNATITADFTSDPSLTALLDSAATPSASDGGGATTTPNAAPRLAAGNLFSLGPAAAVFASVAAAAVGGAALLF
ncbi:GPI anchored protein [Colletotrichum higginsianum]|nr:GPI anchored protein [Colletotrichum higginsianum]